MSTVLRIFLHYSLLIGHCKCESNYILYTMYICTLYMYFRKAPIHGLSLILPFNYGKNMWVLYMEEQMRAEECRETRRLVQ